MKVVIQDCGELEKKKDTKAAEEKKPAEKRKAETTLTSPSAEKKGTLGGCRSIDALHGPYTYHPNFNPTH